MDFLSNKVRSIYCRVKSKLRYVLHLIPDMKIKIMGSYKILYVIVVLILSHTKVVQDKFLAHKNYYFKSKISKRDLTKSKKYIKV